MFGEVGGSLEKATAETYDLATADTRTVTELPMPVDQDASVATAARAELSQDTPEPSREPVTADASRPRLLVLIKKLKPWWALLVPMIVRLIKLMNNDER